MCIWAAGGGVVPGGLTRRALPGHQPLPSVVVASLFNKSHAARPTAAAAASSVSACLSIARIHSLTAAARLRPTNPINRGVPHATARRHALYIHSSLYRTQLLTAFSAVASVITDRRRQEGHPACKN